MSELYCADPFYKHSKPFKKTEKNRKQFRLATQEQSLNCSVALEVGALLCDSCRYKVEKHIVCSNPFKSHGEKRKHPLKRFFKVQEELANRAQGINITILAGQLLCESCKCKVYRRLAPADQHEGVVYCADPLKRHKKPLKRKTLYFFNKVADHHVHFCTSNKIQLDNNDYLCAACRADLEKKCIQYKSALEKGSNDTANDLNVSENEQDMEIDPNSENSSTTSAVSNFDNLDTQVVDINKVLSCLNVTNISKTTRHSKREIQNIYDDAKSSLATMLNNFAVLNIDLEDSLSCKCKFCQECMPLILKRFKEALTKHEMYHILTCTPQKMSITELQSVFGISQRMAQNVSKLRKLGPCSAPSARIGNKLSQEIVDKVINFYLDPSNSYVMPGQRDTIIIKKIEKGNVVKTAVAKHLMMTTLNDFYAEFKHLNQDVKISKTKFAELRPLQVYWGKHKGFGSTCLCIYHCNFKLLMEAIQIDGKTEEILSKFLCGLTESCMLGLCKICPTMQVVTEALNNIECEEIEYFEWSNDSSRSLELIKRAISKDDFLEKAKAALAMIGEHHFVHMQQRDFIRDLKLNFVQQNGSVVINVDFGENYNFVVRNAVQGFHWNNSQATIHPFVVHWYCQTTKEHKTFCCVVISNCLVHDATSFHVFRSKVLHELLNKFYWIKSINYVSDGAPAQYKCAKNFANLAYHFTDFGVKARWSFFATCHGKDLCDAFSGITKRETRLESLRTLSNPILTAKAMFEFLHEKKTSNSLQYIYVDSTEIEEFVVKQDLDSRYSFFKSTPGTRKFHDVECSEDGLKFRKTSTAEEFYLSKFGPTTTQCDARLTLASSLKPGHFVAFLYTTEKVVFTGCIDSILEDSDEITIIMMRKTEKGNGFRWFSPEKRETVYLADVICRIDPPDMIHERMYKFSPDEMKNVYKKATQMISDIKKHK